MDSSINAGVVIIEPDAIAPARWFIDMNVLVDIVGQEDTMCDKRNVVQRL